MERETIKNRLIFLNTKAQIYERALQKKDLVHDNIDWAEKKAVEMYEEIDHLEKELKQTEDV